MGKRVATQKVLVVKVTFAERCEGGGEAIYVNLCDEKCSEQKKPLSKIPRTAWKTQQLKWKKRSPSKDFGFYSEWTRKTLE